MGQATFRRQIAPTALIFALFLMLAAGPAPAEQPVRIYATGDGDYDPSELQGLPSQPLTRTFVPEAVSLADRFPQPGDQQNIGSCVAWSVGYAARSYYEIVAAATPTDDLSRIVSPASLHAQMIDTGARCESPRTNILRGLKVLQARGARSLAQHPITSPENFCGTDQSAGSFRIRGIGLAALPLPRFGSSDRRTGLKPDSVDRIRLALASGHPVIISMYVGKSFMKLSRGEIYSGSIHERRDDGLPGQAGHAMVITGYDNGRRAFQVMNSWGTEWADGGFAWIDYDTMLSDARYGFVMRTDNDPPRPAAATPGQQGPRLPGLAASDTECADLDVSRGRTVEGFVATEAARQRVESIARDQGLRSEVALRPWPVCEALQTLRAARKAAHRPRVRLVGKDRELRVGEAFAIEVTPPDVPSYLYVIYIEDDGTVVNLLPRQGVVRRQTDVKSPPLLFGDGLEGRPRFKITPPRSVDASGQLRAPGDPERGHEAIVVVAGRAPIEELEDESPVYAKADAGKLASDAGPADRLLLSSLRDITTRIAKDATKPREVMADVLHLRIVD